MRRILFIAGVVLLSTGIANAACNRYEVSGGYEFLSTSVAVTTEPSGTGTGTGTTTTQSINANGWNAGAAVNATCWLGIAAEFSGVYASPVISGVTITTSGYSYLFGPRFNFRNGSRVTPFAEALFGAATLNLTASGKSNGTASTGSGPAIAAGSSASFSSFAAAFGGGLDIGITKHVAIRGRADYVLTTFGSTTQNHASIAGEIVFRFGGSG